MINRAAILLKYKPPAVRWINEADPHNTGTDISLESANEDSTVYLIMNEEAYLPETLEEWIQMNYEALFENELHGWYTDESLWPKKRDLKLFREWLNAIRLLKIPLACPLKTIRYNKVLHWMPKRYVCFTCCAFYHL